MLIPLGNVHLEQFVCTFLKIDSGLNDEINGSPQVNQILLRQIMNFLFLLLLLHHLLFLQHLLFVVMHLFQVDNILLSQNFQFYGIPLLLCLFVERVEFKYVQVVFSCELLLEVQVVSDLVLSLDQVQLWNHTGMLFETCFADCEQVLN